MNLQYRGTGATRSSLTRYSQRLCILIVIISCSVGTLVAANDTEATQIVAKVGDCEIKFQDYLASTAPPPQDIGSLEALFAGSAP